MDPENVLAKTFEESGGYDEMVLVRDIELESHCEHHMVPIIGRAHVAYIPANRVVGISKLLHVSLKFSRSGCKSKKKLTVDIASTIDKVLKPQGVAVKSKLGTSA